MRHLNLHTAFLIMLFVMAVDVLAQAPRTFVVKEVGAKPVILHQDKKKHQIVSRDVLTLDAIITIPKGGKLVVYDNIRLSEYTIREAGMNTLAKFLHGSHKESYTKVTFAGLIALLFSNEDQKDKGGTIYRGGETDSNNNSLKEYVAFINATLKDPTTSLPEGYAAILEEVLHDIENQGEAPTDTITE